MKQIALGVYEVRGKRKGFATISGRPGKSVYGEKRIKDKGKEYRVWDPAKSKMCASIHKGLTYLPQPGEAVLYLGASTGTTVSHVSDIVGPSGIVFAVEFAPRVARELVFLARDRSNIAPILGDAWQVDTFADRVSGVDYLFQDIAQRNQVAIFLKNVDLFVRSEGICLLAVKARSVDSTKKPKTVFNVVEHELKNSKIVKILDKTILDPFQKDHMLFVCEKLKEK